MRPACRSLAFALAVAVAGLPVTAAGHPAIYKCVAGDGRAAYQSTPCREGLTQAWTRELFAEVPTTPAPVVADAGPRRANAARPSATSPPAYAPAHSRASTRPRPDVRASACDTAKSRRADIRDRHWRTIRFDQLRDLDDEVARACRS